MSTMTVGTPRSRGRLRPRRARLLAGLELFTGATALVGGVLLVARPDGALMKAETAALARSPFSSWRVPGVLLAALVGGGFIAAGGWQLRNGPYARELSIVAGFGLVAFEAVELAWIGFQPLEAVFAGIGVVVVLMAWTLRPSRQ
jgi:hypothetical protein